jgi:prefoldin subunit 5
MSEATDILNERLERLKQKKAYFDNQHMVQDLTTQIDEYEAAIAKLKKA